jgi:hypothetical protein
LGRIIGGHDHQHFFPGQHTSISPDYLLTVTLKILWLD